MDFQPFAFRINDDALPELVGDYTFNEKKNEFRHFNYSELKEEQHKQALETAFSEAESYGYNDLMDALKCGYSSIGCEYGENKLEKLKKFLENKRMIVKDSARKYSFNLQFNY